MKMSGHFLLLLIIVGRISSGLTSVISKNYKYIQSGSNWVDAQSFCRAVYTDLATIYIQADLNNLNLEHYFAWIKDTTKDGSPYNPNTENCAAVKYSEREFDPQPCTMQLFFICQNSERTAFIPQAMTYTQAQPYCINNGFGDLVTFGDSNSENSILKQQDFPIWIGLHQNGGSWNWSSGLSYYRNWTAGEPSNNGNCVSVSSVTMKMATNSCDTSFPFICMLENVFLVKENKSWEEALEYCRNLTSPTNSSLHFDLLSVEPGDEHEYVMSKVMEADTEEVWTGLRFLADEWLWVNGADMLYHDLPGCPLPRQHCGALSKNNTGSVKAKGCLERKNFLCYSY